MIVIFSEIGYAGVNGNILEVKIIPGIAFRRIRFNLNRNPFLSEEFPDFIHHPCDLIGKHIR